MVDHEGIPRGKCDGSGCACPQYKPQLASHRCQHCDHIGRDHEELGKCTYHNCVCHGFKLVGEATDCAECGHVRAMHKKPSTSTLKVLGELSSLSRKRRVMMPRKGVPPTRVKPDRRSFTITRAVRVRTRQRWTVVPKKNKLGLEKFTFLFEDTEDVTLELMLEKCCQGFAYCSLERLRETHKIMLLHGTRGPQLTLDSHLQDLKGGHALFLAVAHSDISSDEEDDLLLAAQFSTESNSGRNSSSLPSVLGFASHSTAAANVHHSSASGSVQLSSVPPKNEQVRKSSPDIRSETGIEQNAATPPKNKSDYHVQPNKHPAPVNTLAPPEKYYREAMGTGITVECLQYDVSTDELIGPLVDWADRVDEKTYLVGRVTCGKEHLMSIDMFFEPDVRVSRVTAAVNAYSDREEDDFGIAWQSPYQVYSTTETCLIGVIMSPLLSKEVIYQWIRIEDGNRIPFGSSQPFVSVGEGCYTAKVTYFTGEGVTLSGYLNLINVKKSDELFKDAGIEFLKPDQYTLTTSKLGGGFFGSVYRGDYCGPVAIKRIETHHSIEVFKAEINIAGKLNHKNLIRLIGVCSLPNEIHIIMELIQGKDLAKIFQTLLKTKAYKGKERIMSTEQSMFVLQQICQGLDYLHRIPVVHSDIKPGNIMVQDNFVVKILDFSVSRIKTQAREDATRATSAVGQGPGTVAYMAPEVFNRTNTKRQTAADIWALGIIIVENANHGALVYNSYQDVALGHVTKRAPAGLANVPEGLIPVTTRALSYEPSERPEAKEIGKAIGLLYSEIAFLGQKPLW